MNMERKVCTKCNVEKSLDEFVKRSNSPNGYRPNCKICYNKYKKKKYDINPTQMLESCKKYRDKNPNYIKIYRDENREKILNKMKEYYGNNREKLNEDMRKRNNERKKIDFVYKLSCLSRTRIGYFLRIKNMKKNNKTFGIVGCSPEFLKEYLETQFKEGMSWQNHGLFGWHIDHIIPLSSAKTEEEIYKLCHYTNLQPLWADDNIKKSNKLLKTI